jgi:cbb3-type cytochrome oxidase maturation protein
MKIIFMLVPISLMILIIAIACFFWAIRSGQYDDLDRYARDILLDDAKDKLPTKRKNKDE